MKHLLEFGKWRIEAKFKEAAQSLQNYQTVVSTVPDAHTAAWLNNERLLTVDLAKLSDPEQKLAGKLIDIDRARYEPELSNLINKIYSCLDSLAKEYGAKFGIVQVSPPNTCKWTQDWIQNYPPDHYPQFKNKVDRMRIRGALLLRAEESEFAAEALDLKAAADCISSLEKLVETRNKSRSGHGTEIVEQDSVTDMVDDAVVTLHKLYQIVTGHQLEYATCLDLNKEIHSLLTLADSLELTIDDFEDANQL